MKTITVQTGEGILKITAMLIFCGKDLSIILCGGEQHHIGASAIALPRPSLKNDGNHSASASVICVPGHKEDEVARTLALRFSQKYKVTVHVVAGIHVDHASAAEIRALLQNINKAADLLEAQL